MFVRIERGCWRCPVVNARSVPKCSALTEKQDTDWVRVPAIFVDPIAEILRLRILQHKSQHFDAVQPRNRVFERLLSRFIGQ